MTAENYDACYAITLKWEGGYVNHPKDPGGATNRGVIQRVYDGYRRRKGLPTQSVRAISDDEVREIYRTQYWNAVRGDDLPAGVDLAVWDFGVNSGPSRAIKYLQRILGVRQDGKIGEVTLAAVAERDPRELAVKLCNDRLAFVMRLRTWPTFGKGWKRRIDSVRTAAARMAMNAPQKPQEVEPEEPQAKAEGPPAVTKQEGFWAKVGALVTSMGAGVASILQGLDWRVGIALVIVAGVIVGAYWLKTKDDEA